MLALGVCQHAKISNFAFVALVVFILGIHAGSHQHYPVEDIKKDMTKISYPLKIHKIYFVFLLTVHTVRTVLFFRL